MKKAQGFTLVEMMVSLGISSIGVLIFLSMSSTLSKGQKSSEQTSFFKGDLNLMASYLRKNAPGGDVRIYGDRPDNIDINVSNKFRQIIPFPGKCRDFVSTHANCTQSTALFYMRYDKATSPSVMASCRYTQSSDEYLLINASDTTYGTATFDTDGFSVGTFGIGTKFLSLKANSLALILSSPLSYVWRVASAPVLYPTTASLPAGACTTPENTAAQVANSLYKLKINPFFIGHYLDNSLVEPSSATSTLGDSIFPTNLSSATIEVLGLKPAAGGTTNLGISRCRLTSAHALSCLDMNGTTIPDVTSLRIDEKFKIPLRDTSNSNAVLSQQFMYEILGDTQTPTCSDGSCGTFPLKIKSGNEINIDMYASNTEVQTHLENTFFSLYKQNELQIMRLRFTKNNKENVIDFFLP